MRKLLAGIVLVVALLAALDVTTRVLSERQLTNKAQEGVPPGATVAAHIYSLPFLGRIAANGKVDEVDFHLTSVKVGSLTYPTADFELHGVRLNRHRLLSRRQVRIVDIDSGRLSTELRADDLSTALNHQVFIRDSKLYVDAAGRQVEVKPRIADGKTLVLAAAGIDTLSLTLPDSKLLPCASDVAIGSTTIQISCSIAQVPPPLIDAANAAAGG